MLRNRGNMISYKEAPDIEARMLDIVKKLEMDHVKTEDVKCIRSKGSSTRRTIARCHGLGKVMQLGLNRKGFYVLEFLSERFDKMSKEDQIKTIIHELMHIPFSFGGGFKHHDYVCDRNVDKLFDVYRRSFL